MNDPFGDIPATANSATKDPFGDIPARKAGTNIAPLLDPVGTIEKGVQTAGKWLDKKVVKPVAGAITYGHQHPLEAFMGPLQAGQRALRASELNDFGGEHNDIGHAFMTPKVGPRLQQDVDTKLGIGPGGWAEHLFSAPVARGLRLGEDVLNDPLTVAPVGKVLDLAKGIPGVKPVLKAASDFAGNTVGRALNPQEYLRGLTPEAQAEFEVATNRAMTTVRQQKEAEDKIVAAHADEIRRGIMPPEVAALFDSGVGTDLKHIPSNAQPGAAWKDTMSRSRAGQSTMDAWKQYFPEGLKPGTRPQDVVSALFQNRAKVFKTQAMEELKKQGFFTSADAIRAGAPSKFTAPLDEIPDLQEHLRSVVENKITPESKNILVKGARTLTHRGNQAFLANPAPHAGNLANLAYNKYGPITALQGLGNAARVATGTVGKGKLAQNIGELESLGAKSQYGNIFDELGLTRLAGIPGTEGAAKVANRALIPLQRASNYAQHKILNSTETGLRSAALDAEKRAGRTGPQAAQSIHKTFGTDAPNAVTHGLQQLAVPFAQFHWQTAPGSVANTLLRNPARISNPIKAEQDLNNRRGPQYRSTVPGANAPRMAADPLGYFSNFGPLGGIEGPYSILTLLKSGKPAKIKQAAAEVMQRYTPGSPEAAAIAEMLAKKKGQSGESGGQDLFSALAGGYWGKR